VATQSNATFFSVDSADIFSKWQGESERLVRTLFEMAHEYKRTVIFVDELDSLCGSRSPNEDESTRRVKTLFLTKMSGVIEGKGDVLVLAATNLPWEIDSGIRRRLEKRVLITLPNKDARIKLIKLNVRDSDNDLTESDYERLGEMTSGASGADISVMVKEAKGAPFRKCIKAKQFRADKDGILIPCVSCEQCPSKLPSDPSGKTNGCQSCGAICMTLYDIPPKSRRLPHLEMKDFETILQQRPISSVSQDELARYNEWTEEFGQEGN